MKKLLFISLDYYHYPQVIKEKFEEVGYEVDYFPIEPRTMFYKISRYMFKSLYRKRIDLYHKDIIDQSSSIEYDIVFFITTHFFSQKNLKQLRISHEKARFISYHWDSIKQYNFLGTEIFFDKVFSFDKEDCKTHDFEYLPLFASDIYDRVLEKKDSDIDIYTVSSIVNPERYVLIQRFKQFCLENNITYHFYIKVTFITYIRILIRTKSLPKDVSFRAMDQRLMKNIVERSKAVLDIKNNTQSGLTMRIIENIVAGKKIVTSNKGILDEVFYEKDRIFVLEHDNLLGLKDFIQNKSEIQEYPELTLKHWIERILS